MTKKTETLERKDYSQKERDAMDDSDFGDPENQAFPIKTAQDVINAASRLHNASGDQSAIKARIKRIAKRKGFPLPQTWQDEDKDDKERSMGAEHTHEALTRADSANHEPYTGTHSHSHDANGSQGDDASHEHEHSHDGDNNHDHTHADRAAGIDAPVTPESLLLYAPIVRTDTKDWIVEGQVTSDQLDHYGTIFDYEASKQAFADWRGNIREQHDNKKAVGRAIDVIPDDATRTIFLRARISKGARDTWEKILDGTLSGFSVGADPRQVETTSIMRNGKSVPVYRVKKWAEVSVVDNPGSPGCDIVPLVRADGIMTDVIDNSEDETPAVVVSPESGASSESLDRAGARLSADSRAALHDMRDKAMSLCGCDECCGMQGGGEPDGDEGMDRAVMAALERVLPSAIERILTPVYSRLQGIAGTLARSNAAPSTANLEDTLTRALDARMANLLDKSSLDEVRASLETVKGQVEKIADTPVPGAPVMHAGALPRPVDKRLPTDDPYRMPQSRGATADAVAALFNAGQLDTTEKQVDAVAAALSAQRRGR